MTKLGVVKTERKKKPQQLSFRSIEKSHNSDNITITKFPKISSQKVEMKVVLNEFYFCLY